MTKLVAGNWKMNGLAASLDEARAIAAAADRHLGAVTVMLCPPATLIDRLAKIAAGSALLVGAQDCHKSRSGAHTGDISAEMLADAGARAVIVGHSERRSEHGETDADVRAKAEAALDQELTAIICVGETEAERDAGRALSIVESQLDGSVPEGEPARIVIAYEPVWAIGSGRTPTGDDIAAMHRHIREWLTRRFGEASDAINVLYGGSMKPSNAAEIMGLSEVGGGLVGGASLKAADFVAIIEAAAAH